MPAWYEEEIPDVIGNKMPNCYGNCSHRTPNGECYIGFIEDCPKIKIVDEIKMRITDMLLHEYREKYHLTAADIQEILDMLAGLCGEIADNIEDAMPLLEFLDECIKNKIEALGSNKLFSACDEVYKNNPDLAKFLNARFNKIFEEGASENEK